MSTQPEATRPLGPEILELDEGLKLVMTKAEDGPAEYAFVNAQRGHLGRYQSHIAHYTLARAVDHCREYRSLIDSGQLLSYWMVGPEGQTVGDVKLFLRANGEGELAYQVAESEQGRGYATRGSRALLRVAAACGLQRVVMHIDPENEPSQRVARRLGGVLNTSQTEDDFGAWGDKEEWEVRLRGKD